MQEETTFVLMQKNSDTGFLEKELGAYTIASGSELFLRGFMQEQDGTALVHLWLGCPRETEDWEFEAVYDYYDETALSPFVSSFAEEDGHYDPVWHITLPYLENPAEMSKLLNDIAAAHEAEIASVFEAIADKKDDYREEI